MRDKSIKERNEERKVISANKNKIKTGKESKV